MPKASCGAPLLRGARLRPGRGNPLGIMHYYTDTEAQDVQPTGILEQKSAGVNKFMIPHTHNQCQLSNASFIPASLCTTRSLTTMARFPPPSSYQTITNLAHRTQLVFSLTTVRPARPNQAGAKQRPKHASLYVPSFKPSHVPPHIP